MEFRDYLAYGLVAALTVPVILSSKMIRVDDYLVSQEADHVIRRVAHQSTHWIDTDGDNKPDRKYSIHPLRGVCLTIEHELNGSDYRVFSDVISKLN